MSERTSYRYHAILAAALAAGCASGATGAAEAPSPPEPDAAQSAGSPKGDEAPPDAEPAAESEGETEPDAKPAGESAAEEPDTGGPSMSRTPGDIVTAPDTLFVLDFADSEPGVEADERCEAQSKGQPKVKNECMKRARQKVEEDALSFVKDDRGRWRMITSRQRGKELKELRKVVFEIVEEKEHTVKLKLHTKPPSVLEIEVPNEYSIVVPHPRHGKLAYDAKIGIVGRE